MKSWICYKCGKRTYTLCHSPLAPMCKKCWEKLTTRLDKREGIERQSRLNLLEGLRK